MSFRVMAFSLLCSPFGDHIIRVIRGCAKEKMVDANAPAVIACVAYQHFVGYCFVGKQPGYAMSLKELAVYVQLSVPSAIY